MTEIISFSSTTPGLKDRIKELSYQMRCSQGKVIEKAIELLEAELQKPNREEEF